MANTKVTKILMRQGSKHEWDVAGNPVLENGEIAIESDTYRMKIGQSDTPTGWDDIEYFAAGITSIQLVNDTLENALKIDSVGKLDLDIDNLLDDLNNKVNRTGDEMTGPLYTPVIEAGVGAIHGGFTVDSSSAFLEGITVGDNSAFNKGLEVHGLFTADTNAAIGGSLDVVGGFEARSGKLNDFDPDIHTPGDVYPFMAVDDEDIVTLAFLRDSIDGLVDFDTDFDESINAVQDSIAEVKDSVVAISIIVDQHGDSIDDLTILYNELKDTVDAISDTVTVHTETIARNTLDIGREQR